MTGKFETPRSRKSPVPLLLAGLILAGSLLTALFLLRPGQESPLPEPSSETTVQPAQTEATASTEETAVTTEATLPPPSLISTATVGAQGDLLMHEPVISSGRSADGSYDFSYLFQYIGEYVQALDYAAMNLETTLGGSSYPYQGNPEFNCPDTMADALKDAGYDMILTANNHASDTYASGMFRTLEQLRSRSLTTLGTMLNDEEKKYEIVDINGIRLGMICYTYATNELSEGQPSLNHRAFIKNRGIVNYFLENNLDRFFDEAAQRIASMKEEGAEAIIFYMHWGKEYVTQANSTQEGIAQRLCDLGADIIIGGHPHVVQPVEYLESSVDPNHSALCIYSVGNLVSNQMKSVDQAFKSGHSEDGALFRVTFGKYDDGSVAVTEVDVLPTWVNRNTNSGSRRYDIIPLDLSRQEQWQELYGLTDEQFASAKESYTRTMDIVGAGLDTCRQHLAP